MKFEFLAISLLMKELFNRLEAGRNGQFLSGVQQ
jgi:hypothetical protein